MRRIIKRVIKTVTTISWTIRWETAETPADAAQDGDAQSMYRVLSEEELRFEVGVPHIKEELVDVIDLSAEHSPNTPPYAVIDSSKSPTLKGEQS